MRKELTNSIVNGHYKNIDIACQRHLETRRVYYIITFRGENKFGNIEYISSLSTAKYHKYSVKEMIKDSMINNRLRSIIRITKIKNKKRIEFHHQDVDILNDWVNFHGHKINE